MSSLLNRERPPVFCPGCSHDLVVRALDKALVAMGKQGTEVAIVTDIGCSGLFDTFFNSHAMHGLHGRALTYATGLKMARPELTVITIMGDGGMGIGGAHFLSSCRRNLDITLLVLNNFNYGMTGGQCSVTTSPVASTASGFLNELEPSLDICKVASAAGSPWVDRAMATEKKLPEQIRDAVQYQGFSLVDIWGVCPGRYSKRNRVTLKGLEEEMTALPPVSGVVQENERDEYADLYRRKSSRLSLPPGPVDIEPVYSSAFTGQKDILLLGAAGQRVNTAGELLCLAAMSAGLHVSQKNDYPITVLRGHSISEVVLSSSPVLYTGAGHPDVVFALAREGVTRRRSVFEKLKPENLVIRGKGVEVPEHEGKTITIDFKKLRIPSMHWALISLAVLAEEKSLITEKMLRAGLAFRFSGNSLEEAESLLNHFFSRKNSYRTSYS